MHDVAAFLVRRDHRLARELRDLIEADATPPVGSADARRLGRLRLALDAALADWLDDDPHAPTGTAPSVATRATATEAAADTRVRETQQR